MSAILTYIRQTLDGTCHVGLGSLGNIPNQGLVLRLAISRGQFMFKVSERVLLDPSESPPQVFIKTTGLVVDQHRVLLPAHNDVPRWERDGTNVPTSSSDPGTPDVYVIPEFTQQGGNILIVSVDIMNVRTTKQSYGLQVEIHQADYEPDILFNEKGSVGTTKGTRVDVFKVFIPLRIMT